MIYYYELKHRCIDKIATLFVMAVNTKIHLKVITRRLENSELIKQIENNNYNKIFDEDCNNLFKEIFGYEYADVSPFMDFNEAYWCGYIYVSIFYKFQKPFSYIFKILPLDVLMNKYSVYHEMDIDQMYDFFLDKEKEETILSRILKERKMSLSALSKKTGISINTLKKYKYDNNNLYNGKFSIIKKIADYLQINDHVFLEHINIEPELIEA